MSEEVVSGVSVLVTSMLIAGAMTVGSPLITQWQPTQNSALAGGSSDPYHRFKLADSGPARRGGSSSGGVWGAFGALSGKDSPVSAPSAVPSGPPPNASGSPGKIIMNREQKFQIYNYGRLSGMVCNMTAAPKTFAQKGIDQIYGVLVATAKEYQLPLAPQPKRIGVAKADAIASWEFASKQMIDVEKVLETRYGTTERFIFDIGCKAYLLQAMYEPSDPKIPATDENVNDQSKNIPMTEALVAVFKLRGEEAMPERIWKPFVDAIDRRAPNSEIDKQLEQMNVRVEEWFLPKGAVPRN